RLKEPRRAWQHAEADLARGLLDDMGGALGEDAALLVQLRQLDERLLPLLGLRQLTLDQQRLRQDLTRQRSHVFRRLAADLAARSAERVWKLPRIQKHLPADAALVLWVSAGAQCWACVLRSHGPPRWQRLPGSGARESWTREDRDLPSRLHAALADRNS